MVGAGGGGEAVCRTTRRARHTVSRDLPAAGHSRRWSRRLAGIASGGARTGTLGLGVGQAQLLSAPVRPRPARRPGGGGSTVRRHEETTGCTGHISVRGAEHRDLCLLVPLLQCSLVTASAILAGQRGKRRQAGGRPARGHRAVNQEAGGRPRSRWSWRSWPGAPGEKATAVLQCLQAQRPSPPRGQLGACPRCYAPAACRRATSSGDRTTKREMSDETLRVATR
jgi:hypothetical protein